MTHVETALERALSTQIMREGHKPKISTFAEGEAIMKQGEADDHIVLLLDGMVSIDVDGNVVAEAGPGAVLGERAALEGGHRTATVTAVTPVKVATTTPDHLALEDLEDLAKTHGAD